MAESTARVVQRGAYLRLADGAQWPVTDELTASTEVERVRSLTATKPDESWSLIDPNGHEHRYVRDEDGVPRLPSLEPKGRLVECDGACGDGDCGGYTITEWFCRECGEQVEPGFRHDYEAEQSGIPVSTATTWTVKVEVPAPPTDPIEGAAYTYVDKDGNEHRHPLPPLYVGTVEAESGPDGFVMRAQLHGTEWKSVERKPTGP